ncbi:uncharacterized protein I303_100413 [Kwoniella dejecticola CBS 10117]|uniref:Uncharacterized protein n=1 Tax=Kwoniella dejecticola CBS 10117 TaxID=1296121 RepID=A0A1A6AEW0_9TREE|nr:uncharacterized protein I303_00413 [Kwoniella dejecticola CBS 10117]OBR88596.1 hypothetical protein I303_00413 [Kwoniella dejecticola CBS 10117]
MSYHANTPTLQAQPSIEQPYVAKQPAAKSMMNASSAPSEESKQQEEAMRLRGGCPGHLCGLPILPCRCDICIIPIPCC